MKSRPIHLLTITNAATGKDTSKPALWIDANIHATELTGATTALAVAYHLLSSYGNDAQVTRLVDTCTFYIVPRISPDGAAAALAVPPKRVRSSKRYFPWEEKADGLYAEDIDGDGRILQMRLVDPNGDWKISPLNPRLMAKRSPDEQGGVYYRLLPEGRIENFDGWQVKIAPPPKNWTLIVIFPFNGAPITSSTAPDRSPVPSLKSTPCLKFISEHNNINVAITFHTYSRVILRPYGTKPDSEMNTDDLWVLKKISERGTAITGYRCVSVFHDFQYHPKEVITGVFDDWMYDHLGVFSYTIELWDLPTEAGIKDRKFIEFWREHPHEEDVQILKWVKEHAPERYVNWYTFNHPQLGPVELGGWDSLYVWSNPPAHLVGAEAARQVPYMVALAEMLPHLSVVDCQAKAVADGSYHVNLVVKNTGYLPSFTSRQAQTRQAARPVWAELVLPEGAALSSGEKKQDLGHLEGRSNNFTVTALNGSTGTSHRGRVDWVVRGQPGMVLQVTIKSDRAGILSCDMVLP